MKNIYSIRKTNSQFSIVSLLSYITVVIVLMFSVNAAMAHATLIKSDPSRRASLSVPPKQIQLWFNEKIEVSYATVVVFDVSKNPVTQNGPEAVADDPKSVILHLPDLEAGRYTVQYRVMSVDGHVIESSYDFIVKSKT